MKSRLLTLATVASISFGQLAAAKAQLLPEPPSDTPKKKSLDWDHPRFRTSEYVATATMAAGWLTGELLWKRNGDAQWKGGILLDKPIIGMVRPEASEARNRAAQVSDYLLYASTAYPYLDAGIAWGRGAGDTAWQMSMINTQAFALSGLTTFLFKRLVRRERPWVAECSGSGDPNCKDSQSFLSGHASTAFTGAGLSCAHHMNIPLYGGGAADALACIGALGAATATATLRVVADKHYASDVFAGAVLGLASGYLMPKLLHYGGVMSSSTDTTAKKKSGIAFSAVPMATPGGAAISVSGIFF